MAGFKNSNPAGATTGFGENLFWDHRTICLMKLMASTMLSAVVKRQCSSAVPLLHHCQLLTKFVERQWIWYFYRPSNTNKNCEYITRQVISISFVHNYLHTAAALASAKSGKSC